MHTIHTTDRWFESKDKHQLTTAITKTIISYLPSNTSYNSSSSSNCSNWAWFVRKKNKNQHWKCIISVVAGNTIHREVRRWVQCNRITRTATMITIIAIIRILIMGIIIMGALMVIIERLRYKLMELLIYPVKDRLKGNSNSNSNLLIEKIMIF